MELVPGLQMPSVYHVDQETVTLELLHFLGYQTLHGVGTVVQIHYVGVRQVFLSALRDVTDQQYHVVGELHFLCHYLLEEGTLSFDKLLLQTGQVLVEKVLKVQTRHFEELVVGCQFQDKVAVLISSPILHKS